MHPVLLKTHFLTLYSYGLSVAVAMALTLALVFRQSARAGVSRTAALDLLFVLFVAGIAGARLFYVLQHWENFRGDWPAMLRLQEGGLVWYGGFLLGFLCGFFYCVWKKQPALFWMDFFAPLAALAHAVGRVGCFLNGCCSGRPTNFFLGVRFPEEAFCRHPVQLYESALLALLAMALLAMGRKRRKPGEIFAVYVLFYGLMRFALEFLRVDQPAFFYLTLPQWISAVLAAAAVIFLKGARQK